MTAKPACFELTSEDLMWDVDVLTDDTVAASGIDSLKFPSRSPNGSAGADPEMKSECSIEGDEELTPCSPGTPILAEGLVRASSTTATNLVKLGVDWYDSAKAYLSTTYVANEAVSAANTWVVKSGVATAPASTAFYGIRFGKSDTAFDVWWDSVSSEEFPVCAQATLSTGQAITPTWPAPVLIEFDDSDFDYGGLVDTVNHRINIDEPGVYQVSWCFGLSSLASNTLILGYVIKDGTTIVGKSVADVGNASNFFVTGSIAVVFTAPGYLEGTVSANDASCGIDDGNTTLTVVRIR